MILSFLVVVVVVVFVFVVVVVVVVVFVVVVVVEILWVSTLFRDLSYTSFCTYRYI